VAAIAVKFTITHGATTGKSSNRATTFKELRMCNRITSVIAAAVFTVQLLAPSPALPHDAASDGMSIDEGYAGRGTWSLVASMQVPRQSHQGVRLKTGIVLVVGGNDNQTSSLASAELFNPRTGEWTFAPSMLEPRYDFAAIRLANGEVLVAGGFKTGTGNIAAAELYDPRLNTWRATGSMNMPRRIVGPSADGERARASTRRVALRA
jgi:hypothetical protein